MNVVVFIFIKRPQTVTLCTKKSYVIDPSMVKDVQIVEEKVHVHKYTPGVIEPSFGNILIY